MSIAENIKEIKSTVPAHVELVAVSKTKPNSDILEAYNCGQRIFGENKVQELQLKQPALPDDIQWHFIGHLQSNKIKYIASFISLIHGVDKIKLLQSINKEAKKNNRIIDCLLQFHIASEDTKFGLNIDEAKAMLQSDVFKEMHHIKIRGVMGMATYTDDKDQIHREFRQLKETFDYLKQNHFESDNQFNIISMGMSGDYPLAIDEGSTMIRVGSRIFGSRNYQK